VSGAIVDGVDRVMRLWTTLTGMPLDFVGGVSLAVAPRSRLCPAGWVGLVGIGQQLIATVATSQDARRLEDELRDCRGRDFEQSCVALAHRLGS
jgi:hypothetical protein